MRGSIALDATLVACSPSSDPPGTPIDGPVEPDAVPDAAPDAPVARGTFRNPLDVGPDPFMTFHDGFYYLATTQGDAVRMKKARSLGELAVAPAVTIWDDTEPSRDQHVWAPAFYFLDGRWYLYYTADDGIDEHHRLHVAESEGADPMGPYHYKGKLEPAGATGLFAIDAVILEQSGARYMLWSGAGSQGHNLIYIARMANPWSLTGQRTYLPASGGCTEVREAPAILQKDGVSFLVYSACDTGKPDYQLWMKSIPMTDDPLIAANWTQHGSAIFQRDDAAGVWGPGSNGFFKSPDGTEDWIVYHAKNTGQYTYDFRTTRAQRIEWANGLPVLGTPVATGATLELPAGDPGSSTRVIDDTDVTYSAGWTGYTTCGVQCFEGDDHGSAQVDATATFAFDGTQIALFSVRDAGNGIAAFSIDNGPETTRDYFAPIRQGELPIYTSPKLPAGPHTLRVRVTGNKAQASAGTAISIDRAEVFTD